LQGVVSTRVGYAGGTTASPTYRNIGNHSESIQIVFDPEVISYEALIRIFWESHNPVGTAYSQQYRSIVFFHNEEQEAIALATRDALSQELGAEVKTDVRAYENLTPAEAYHQKYYLQSRRDIFDAVKALYPSFDGFVDSTTAARINGYVAGHGTQEQFEEDMALISLPEPVENQLRQRAEAYW